VGLVSGEADERLPVGPRGAQGKQGERGERGLSWRVRWSIVVLFVINFLGAGGNLLWTAYEVSSATTAQQNQQAAQRKQAAAEQASQQRAGAVIEGKLCTSLEPLAGVAGLKPPPGNPADNPARAFEQQLVVKLAPLAQLGPDLGCNATKGKS
jgi:hypothetical protein